MCIRDSPHCESETWPHLQDGKAVGYELGEALGGLVIGRVRLEHQPGHLSQRGAELARMLWFVDNDFLVVKLYPGLHNHGDHPLERGRHAGCGEGVPVGFKRGHDGLWRCYFEMIDLG